MTDIRQKKENVNAFERFKTKLKENALRSNRELILPQPDDIKTLMNKMDKLLKLIESN